MMAEAAGPGKFGRRERIIAKRERDVIIITTHINRLSRRRLAFVNNKHTYQVEVEKQKNLSRDNSAKDQLV